MNEPKRDPVLDLLTIAQAAQRLGVSRRTLYTRVASGAIPVIRLGGRVVRIDPRDLDAYVARSRTGRDEEARS